MSVTIKEFFTKKVTQEYPENRATLVISDRWRADLVMPHDENNEHACTACSICQMNCPNGTITVIPKTIETPEGKKKKVLDEYWYDLGTCTFCNLCVLTCPSDAIVFSNNFESAVFTRSKLKEKLNHEGSKLREKQHASKSAAPKAAPAPKPAAVPAAEKAQVDAAAPKAPEKEEVKKAPEATEVKTEPVVQPATPKAAEAPAAPAVSEKAAEDVKESPADLSEKPVTKEGKSTDDLKAVKPNTPAVEGGTEPKAPASEGKEEGKTE